MRLSRSGFTLIELLVVIAIIATLLALIIPTPPGSREAARANTCRNNLLQLQRALALESEFHRGLPGYINAMGAKDGPKTRASWVVTTFPYLEQQELWDNWLQVRAEFSPIEIFICPSDPPVDLNEPHLSYAANSGYIGDANRAENAANGLFFDRTRTSDGAPGPSDERDGLKQPLLQTNLKAVFEAEGQTLLLSENTHALYWGYVSPDDQQNTKDRSYHFGFCWEQPKIVEEGIANHTIEGTGRINGNHEERELKSFADMKQEDGFPSSYHLEFVNIAFTNGSARSVHEDIDPLVYAQLMTSDHEKSDLMNAAGKAAKELPQPKDEDY